MEDTFIGFGRTLRIKRYIQCSVCKGQNGTCDECQGSAKCITLPYLVEFEAGVPSQYTQEYLLPFDYDNRYAPSRISVTIIEMKHEKFKRFGNDLVMEMDLDFLKEAMVGFTKVITTIDKRKLIIRKECQSTQDMEKMIVRREGFVHFRNKQEDRGDLILFFRIKKFEPIPKLTDATVALLQQVIPAKEPSRIFPAENMFVAVSLLLQAKINYFLFQIFIFRINSPKKRSELKDVTSQA